MHVTPMVVEFFLRDVREAFEVEAESEQWLIRWLFSLLSSGSIGHLDGIDGE